MLDQLILSLARNLKITLVIVSHGLPSIYAIADRVIMLDKRVKGIVAEGRPQSIAESIAGNHLLSRDFCDIFSAYYFLYFLLFWVMILSFELTC